MSLSRLLEDAVHYAEDGAAVTRTLAFNALIKHDELKDAPGFIDNFIIDGALPIEGQRFRQPRIAATFKRLAEHGLDDFYRGELAREIAADLERAGSPLRLEDLERHKALQVKPLSLRVAGHDVFNMPPPTQGLASLLLLGVYDRLGVCVAEDFDFIHGLVEATKRAFRIRDVMSPIRPTWILIRLTFLMAQGWTQWPPTSTQSKHCRGQIRSKRVIQSGWVRLTRRAAQSVSFKAFIGSLARVRCSKTRGSCGRIAAPVFPLIQRTIIV